MQQVAVRQVDGIFVLLRQLDGHAPILGEDFEAEDRCDLAVSPGGQAAERRAGEEDTRHEHVGVEDDLTFASVPARWPF